MQICNGFHPTSLHIDTTKPSEQDLNAGTPQFHTAMSGTSHRVNTLDAKSVSNCSLHSLIVPVWLHHTQDPEKKTLLYALLDNQLDACFVKNDVLQGLGISGLSIQLKLSMVLGEDMVSCQKINGLVVRGFKEESEIPLPVTYSIEEIPVKRSQIPRPESVFSWPHLEQIADQLMPYRHNVDVALLIGVNCARAIKPRKVIPSSDEDLYAKRTNLGWGVIRSINLDKDGEDDGHCSGNWIISREIGRGSIRTVSHLVMKTQVKEVFGPTQVNRMFELDFNEAIRDDQVLSFQDKKFLNVETTNI